MPDCQRLLSLLALSGLLPAQIAPAPVAAPPAEGVVWRVPIHGGTAAHAPDYGIWTSGDTFKASFHDGFAFYPVLGPSAPRNLPLCWRTRSLVRGNEALQVLPAPHIAHEDWRLQYEHPQFREVYEVREGGIEQLFVLPTRPAGTGDLIVTGAIATELAVADGAARHGALRFLDGAGRAVLEYGAAWALDANGDKVPVTTACDGKTISLAVPGAFLDHAAYPVTIDPVVQVTSLVRSTVGAAIGSTDMGAQSDSTLYRFMVAYTRVNSASDYDVAAVFASFSSPTGASVFGDYSASNSDKNACIAYNAAAQRWLLAWQREFTQSSAQLAGVRVYFHDEGVTTLNSGVSITYAPTSAQPAALRNPDLGGTQFASQGTTAVLVFTTDFPTSTLQDRSDTEVFAYTINCSTRAFGVLQWVGGAQVGTNFDRRAPAINQVAGAGEGWTIVWSQYDHRIRDDDWDLMGSRTFTNGQVTDSATLVSGGTRDVQDMAVAGQNNTFMVSYCLTADHSSTANTELRVLQFDWVRTQPPVLGTARTIATALPPMFALSNGNIAFDHGTGSHWALAYTTRRLIGLNFASTARLVRVGGTGGVTEAAALHDSSYNGTAASVCYSIDFGSFAAAHGSDETFTGSSHPLYVSRFTYPTDAVTVPYGTGCGPATLRSNAPYAGNLNFMVTASSLPAGSVPILFMALGSAALPLDGLGMTSCVFNLDPGSILLNVPGAGARIPLADVPLITGDLYFQYLYTNPGANPAGLQATRGLRCQVR